MPAKLAGLRAALADKVAEQPDATLAELCAWLQAVHGVAASGTLMHRELAKLGVTYKKSPSGRPNRIVPTWPARVRNGARASAP